MEFYYLHHVRSCAASNVGRGACGGGGGYCVYYRLGGLTYLFMCLVKTMGYLLLGVLALAWCVGFAVAACGWCAALANGAWRSPWTVAWRAGATRLLSGCASAWRSAPRIEAWVMMLVLLARRAFWRRAHGLALVLMLVLAMAEPAEAHWDVWSKTVSNSEPAHSPVFLHRWHNPGAGQGPFHSHAYDISAESHVTQNIYLVGDHFGVTPLIWRTWPSSPPWGGLLIMFR